MTLIVPHPFFFWLPHMPATGIRIRMNILGNLRNLVAEQPSDVEGLCRRTKELSIWEGSLWSIMWGLGESYIAPFALFLGAGNVVMAFVGTGPILIMAIAQLLGALLLDRLRRRKPIIIGGMAIQAALYIPLLLLPFLLPDGSRIPALMLCITSYFLFFGISFPPWMSMMGDVINSEERGSYFSRRTRMTTFAMIGAMLLAGLIANNWKNAGHTVVGFAFLFGIASLARFSCIPLMKSHYDAPLDHSEHEAPFSFWDFLSGKANPNFTRFTFSIALMTGSTNISGPFFAVYMLRDLEWSYLQFTCNMMVFMFSQAMFVRWWGSIGDKHGNRAILIATGCLLPILPTLWLFSTNYVYLLWIQVMSGATWSGFNLATTNFIYDSVAPVRRARAMSYYSIINGTASVLGGILIGAWIAEHAPAQIHLGMLHITLLSSLPVVFLVSAFARAVVAVVLLPQFKEIRETDPITTAQILWRLGIGQPLFGQVGSFTPLLRLLRKPPPKENDQHPPPRKN